MDKRKHLSCRVSRGSERFYVIAFQKNQKRVADNAYKHYMRSRPAPASESVKRVKELADVEIGYHPVFRESYTGSVQGLESLEKP